MNDGCFEVHQARSREMRKSIVRVGGRGRGRRRAAKTSRGAEQELLGLDTRVAMIQALLPLGLKAVHGARDARRADAAALRKVLKGLSCRDYASCVDPVAQTFGLSASSLSRRFKRASAKKLEEVSERDLGKYDIVGLFLD